MTLLLDALAQRRRAEQSILQFYPGLESRLRDSVSLYVTADFLRYVDAMAHAWPEDLDELYFPSPDEVRWPFLHEGVLMVFEMPMPMGFVIDHLGPSAVVPYEQEDQVEALWIAAADDPQLGVTTKNALWIHPGGELATTGSLPWKRSEGMAPTGVVSSRKVAERSMEVVFDGEYTRSMKKADGGVRRATYGPDPAVFDGRPGNPSGRVTRPLSDMPGVHPNLDATRHDPDVTLGPADYAGARFPEDGHVSMEAALKESQRLALGHPDSSRSVPGDALNISHSTRWLRSVAEATGHRLASIDDAPDGRTRAERRQAARAGGTDRPFRVLRLVSPDRPSERKGGKVAWSKRWGVRGHWRNQWYGRKGGHREQRVIWIDPFLKGPEDKPLDLRPEVFQR